MQCEVPAINSTWQHYNGNVYKVVLITNMGSTRPEYPVTVVYINVFNGTWWSRPVSEWSRSMTQLSSYQYDAMRAD